MAPSESQIQKLIRLYRSCECLWNPESPAYHSGSVQEDAWQKITRRMKSGLTPDQVKLQVLALRSYYDAECAAIRQSQLEGRSYLPRHSYFKDLLFLGDVLSEETEESKANFCLGQVNCILEDSFILDDYNLIKKDFPQHYSQATVCQCTASFCNRPIDTKPGYTLYKLILEPEEPATSREMKYEAIVGNNGRSASGNDRYYPTSYCVRCRKERTGFGRPPCPPSESESSCSSEHREPSRPKKKQVQKSCSCSSDSETQSCCCPQTDNNSSITNRERYYDWPGPRLCGQTCAKPVAKLRRVSVKKKPCCVDSWKRNNAAMCKRLQGQLAAQRAQDDNEPCCCPKPPTPDRCCCTDRRQSGEDQVMKISPRHGSPQNTRYQSPMDLSAFNNNQPNPVACRCSQPALHTGNYYNNQQMSDPAPYINNQQIQDPGRYNNNQQMQDPGRYNNEQQMQDPGRYINEQQMQEPVRYNNEQQMQDPGRYNNNQQMQDPGRYSNDQQMQKPLRYNNDQEDQEMFPVRTSQCNSPPQQFNVSPTPPNSVRATNQYVEAEYVPCPALVNEYGRSSNPEQPNVCYYVVENRNTYGQQQVGASDPNQIAVAGNPPTLDVQDRRTFPNCQGRCAYSGPKDQDNSYSVDPRRYSEQDTQQPAVNRRPKESQEDYDYKGSPVNRRDQQWEPDRDPRDCPNRGRCQNQGKYTDVERDIQRGWQNDQDYDVDQSRRLSREADNGDSVPTIQNNDYMEDSVRRGPEYYEERPRRRRSRKNDSERDYYYVCPYYRQRNDYGEESAGGRQTMPERDYENSPSQKRRKPDDYADTPTKRRPRRMDQTNLSSKSPAASRKKPQRQDYGEIVSQNSQPAGLPTDNYNGSQKPKIIQQGTGYWQYVECPAYNVQNPRDCPSCRQPNQRRQDREKRISNKTRPPSRNNEKNQSSRNRNRSTVESETSFEEETLPSTNDRPKKDNKPKRRRDDNYCDDDNCDYIVRRDKDRAERKNGLGEYGENRKGKSQKRAVMDTCTDETCPYTRRTPSELQAAQNDTSSKPTSPKRKPKGHSDDEREPKSSSKSKSSTRKRPQTVNNAKDNERNKKGFSSPGKSTKKKAATDDDECDCYSDDNIYDQSYKQKDRDDDVERGERSPRENYKDDSRRNDRNESYKNNERSQRLYQSENTDDDTEYYDDDIDNRGRNDYWDDCECSSDTSEVMRESKNQNYRREESPSNGQKYDNDRPTRRRICRKRNDNSAVAPRKPSHKSKGTDVYESENDYRTNSPKRNDEKLPSKKQSHKSKELPGSEYDYPCSCEEENNNRSPQAQGRNDQTKQNNLKKDYSQERSGETATDLDPRSENTYSKRDRDSSTQIGSPRKYRDEQNDPDAVTKEDLSEKRDTDECKCEYDKEGNDKNVNDNSATKSERVEDDCICETLSICVPFEPKLTTSSKRNPAGNGGPVGMQSPRHHSNDINCAIKPWEYTFHIDLPYPEKSKLVVKKKKMPSPERNSPLRNVKVKSASASPTRSAVPPKTQAGEPVKKRTGVSSISNGRRSVHSGAKRTFDASAAVNSKLPHHLNSASFFICKLQDDDKTEQYLVVVPKESIGPDMNREDPGQGSWKQLHCQRQYSGFQSVSWVNPASTGPVCQSPPHHPTEISELSSSVVPSDLKDATLDIIKEYFQQSMIEGNPGLMGSVQTVIRPQRMLQTILSGPKRHKPVHSPSNKANAAILAENRTVLLTNNPFQNLNMSDNKEEVIVLHPPDPGFRPSKYSFQKDAVEVQLIRVENSDTDVKTMPAPLPPRPPKKPK